MGPVKVYGNPTLAHGNQYINQLRLDVKDLPKLLVVQQDFLLRKDTDWQVSVLAAVWRHFASVKLPKVFLDLARMNAAPDGCCNQLCLVLGFAKV